MFENLKKGLTGMLYTDDGQPEPTTASSVPPAASSPAPVISNAPASATPSDPSVYAEIDKSIQAKLLAALESADASSYQELSDFLDTMADAIPDEGLRWRKGVELLGKKGHSIGALLTDIDKCIGILEEHGRLFSADVAQQLKNRVGSREQSVASLTQQITAKEAQLTALQAEIDAIRQKRDTDQAAISTEQAKVERVQSRFAIVFPHIMTNVKSHRTKLEAFLPKDPK